MSEFLAEAQVLITPNIRGFEAALKAELTAIAKRNPLLIPILPGKAAQSKAATAATAGLADAQRKAGAEVTKAAAATTALTRAETAQAAAARKLAFAQGGITNAATALSAAQIKATRSSAAFQAAERAVEKALLSQDAVLIKTTNALLAKARAHDLAASAALRDARAESISAASHSQTQRGILATTLAQTGLRGATLAASNSFLVGAAAAVAFFKVVQVGARLEEELNVFQATAEATADEMGRVSEAARQLGADISLPSVSAGDAAQAMTELAKAGLDVEDAIAGSRGVLQLAAAAQISNAEATGIAANALNAFGLAGEEAVHVADILAISANESQGSIADIGLAFQQAAAVARLAGVSFEDTAAILTIFARNGLKGSDAGTAFRTAMIRLINPTDKAQKVIDQLGIKIRDAQGNIRPEVFADFADATSNLVRRQREAALAIVFGQDAIRGAAIAGRAGAEGLNEMAIAQERQGAAAELAGARAKGLSGSFNALLSNIETLAGSLSRLTNPVVKLLIDGMNDLVAAANAVPDAFARINEASQRLLPGGKSTEDRIQGFLARAFDPRPAIGDVSDFFAEDAEKIGSFLDTALGQVQGDAAAAAVEVRKLFQEFQKSDKGITALNETALGLQRMIDALEKGDPVAQELARRLQVLLKVLQDTGAIPPINIDILLNAPTFPDFKPDSKRAGKEIFDTLAATLSPELGAALGFDFFGPRGFGKGTKEAIDTIVIPTVQEIPLALDVKFSVAEAQGAPDSELLSILRAQEAKQAAFLERMLARPQTGKQQALTQKAANNLTATQNQIQTILDKQVSDAKAASAKVVTAQNDADQAVLDSLDLEERRRRNAVTAALASEGLKDDIKAATALRNFYKRSIAEVRKTVKDAKTRAQEIAVLTGELIAAEADVRRAQQAQQEAVRQARRDARARLDESLDLDIQIAQATGNRSKEIRAHEAKIKQIQREIRQTRKGSLERKRLILELRQEQKELAELKTEKKKTNDATSALFFEFLQKQQGFAANLLGNLIPGGATGGLVGGGGGVATPAAPGGGLGRESQIQAGRDDGFSRGQGQTTNEILRRILRSLENLNGRAGHPEARYQRVSSGGAMDTM